MTIKTILLVACTLFLMPALSNAQKKEPKKPSKIWYKPVKVETKEVKLEGQNVLSEKEITKFKLTVSNNTKDFIVIKPNECTFKSASGEVAPSDKKRIYVRPLDSENKVLNCVSTEGNSMHDYNISFQGTGFYRSENSVTVPMDDFSIPPAQTVIEEGDFRIELESSYTQSDVQWRAKFKITYTGDGLGIVEPRKITGLTNVGENLVNTNKENIFALEKGDTEVIVTIFKTIKPMIMLWNDALKTAKLTKMEPVVMQFEHDPSIK